MGRAHRNRDFGKVGNFRSNAAGKMATNESLAGRNLTAASRSANVRAQTLRPLGAYAHLNFVVRVRASETSCQNLAALEKVSC